VHSINTGVPHAVVIVEDLENCEVRRLGAALRWHEHFAPKGTNVNFAAISAAGAISLRTYERGVEDETLACGTGMVAAAIVAHELTGSPSPVSVRVRGGDTLEVAFEKQGDDYHNVLLTGPADFVFDGSGGDSLSQRGSQAQPLRAGRVSLFLLLVLLL
jgi:diaminopimelate epimerase